MPRKARVGQSIPTGGKVLPDPGVEAALVGKAPATPKDAETLKKEGNAFFVKHKYQQAYERYSEALELEPENAILWSNRAATLSNMEKHLDASKDARKATQLDPKYAKAWMRLATAEFNLGDFPASTTNWKKAIQCMPAEIIMTEQEKGFMLQLEAGLKKAQAAEDDPYAQQPRVKALSDMPWSRAQQLQGELKAKKVNSSAFVILMAHEQFVKGLDALRSQRPVQRGIETHWSCSINGLAGITSGILCDHRTFYIPMDMKDMVQRLERQCGVETESDEAWKKQSVDIIFEEAVIRANKRDWDDVHDALVTTYRSMLIGAFLHFWVMKNYDPLFDACMKLIEWGVFKRPNELAGHTFNGTSLLNLYKLCLKVLIETQSPFEKPVSDEILEKVKSLAKKMIDASNQPGYKASKKNTPFSSAYWTYAEGDAHAALGWCAQRLAQRKDIPKSDEKKLWRSSVRYYRKAAECLPKDDEYYAIYRSAELQALWSVGAALEETLPIAEAIKESWPGIQQIWKNSGLSERTEKTLLPIFEFQRQAREGLNEGRLTMKSWMAPDGVSIPSFGSSSGEEEDSSGWETEEEIDSKIKDLKI